MGREHCNGRKLLEANSRDTESSTVFGAISPGGSLTALDDNVLLASKYLASPRFRNYFWRRQLIPYFSRVAKFPIWVAASRKKESGERGAPIMRILRISL